MCNVCTDRPTDYDQFFSVITGLRADISTGQQFVEHAAAADQLRFGTGSEWYAPDFGGSPTEYIFGSPDPELALHSFFLCCWLEQEVEHVFLWKEVARHI